MINFSIFVILSAVFYATLKLNRAKLVVWQELVYILASLVVFILSCMYFFPAVLLIVVASIALHRKEWLELTVELKEAAHNFLFTRKILLGDNIIKVSPRVKQLTIYHGYSQTSIHDQDNKTVFIFENRTTKYDHLFPMEFK